MSLRHTPNTARRVLLEPAATQAYTQPEPLSAARETSKVRCSLNLRDTHTHAGCPVPRFNGQGIFFVEGSPMEEAKLKAQIMDEQAMGRALTLSLIHI